MPEYKNCFQSPNYFEETILDENGNVIGTIRIKPSSILWKPSSAQKFYSVTLDRFGEWMKTSRTRASK